MTRVGLSGGRSGGRGPRRVGIMGGTFDPIHHGHLIAAEEAGHAFDLDEVVFVPTGDPWQKAHREVSDAEDRYLMTTLATVTNPRFGVSRVEIEREGPSYAIDTLRSFHDEHGEDTELYFITGADAVLEILTWKDPDEVLKLATFIGATRPGHDIEGLDELGPAVREGVRVLRIPALAISSTEIRERVSEGRPIRYLVPDAVARFIEKRGLYRRVP